MGIDAPEGGTGYVIRSFCLILITIEAWKGLIDWVTAELPCLHVPLNGGLVCRTDREGEIQWQTSCFLSSVGSHDATIQYKSVGGDGQGRATAILIHGNPSKFLQGHNVFGSDDLLALVYEVYTGICAAEGLQPTAQDLFAVRHGGYSLRRLDINHSFELPTQHDVLAWLRAAEYCSKTRHGRPSTKGGTLYWGKTSKRWSLKAYCKGEEISVKKKGHQLPQALHNTPLQEWAANKLRIELVLRGKQLDEMRINRAGLIQRYLWPLFTDFLERIEMSKQITLSDEVMLELPTKLKSTYILWMEGHDLRSTLSRPTYYRHRTELLKYSIDIGIQQQNAGERTNVIPLVRVLQALPADLPPWADELGLVYKPASRHLHAVNS